MWITSRSLAARSSRVEVAGAGDALAEDFPCSSLPIPESDKPCGFGFSQAPLLRPEKGVVKLFSVLERRA